MNRCMLVNHTVTSVNNQLTLNRIFTFKKTAKPEEQFKSAEFSKIFIHTDVGGWSCDA